MAAGAYFIPGIGQVLLTATGVIVIGGVAILGGSWLYKQVTSFLRSSGQAYEISKARKAIPSYLKDKNGNVKIGAFKQKGRGSTTYKERKGWEIRKDRSGHRGSAWKLYSPKGKRIASLKKNGEVVGK